MKKRHLDQIYFPPWRDPETEDPPKTAEEFQADCEAWEFSTAGGGLWDPEEDYPRPAADLTVLMRLYTRWCFKERDAGGL